MSNTPRTDAVEFYAGDLDGGQEAVPADFARDLEREIQDALDLNNANVQMAEERIAHLNRELNATLICAGVAAKERGEWAAEREDLRTALATLLRIEEEDNHLFVESDSELGLAMTAARKALTTWGVKT